MTMKVILVRKIAALSPTRAVALEDGQLMIQPTSSLLGHLSLVNAQQGNESQDPIHQFYHLESQGTTVIQFYSQKDGRRFNVLEITELKGATAETELKIRLKELADAGELIVPVGFDGMNFRVIGHSESVGSGTVVTIDQFPLPEARQQDEHGLVASPFNPDDRQHPSLFQAFKIAFFRTTDVNFMKKSIS